MINVYSVTNPCAHFYTLFDNYIEARKCEFGDCDTGVVFVFPLCESVKSTEKLDWNYFNKRPVVGNTEFEPVKYRRSKDWAPKSLKEKYQFNKNVRMYELKEGDVSFSKTVTQEKVWNPVEHFKVDGTIHKNLSGPWPNTLTKTIIRGGKALPNVWKKVMGATGDDLYQRPIVVVDLGKTTHWEMSFKSPSSYNSTFRYEVDVRNWYVGNDAGGRPIVQNLLYYWQWELYTTGSHAGQVWSRNNSLAQCCPVAVCDWDNPNLTPRTGFKIGYTSAVGGSPDSYLGVQPPGRNATPKDVAAYRNKVEPILWSAAERYFKDYGRWKDWSSTTYFTVWKDNYCDPSNNLVNLKLVDRDISMIFDRLEEVHNELFSLCTSYRCPIGTWNALAAKATDNLGGFTGNGIAYLKDAFEFKETTEKYVQTLKSVGAKRNAKRLKNLASAYLGIHYGYKLMWLDTVELHKALSDFSHHFGISRCQAVQPLELSVPKYAHLLTSSARYQVFYDRYREIYDPIHEFLTEFDLNPTLENVWDLIPLSFVVDWFTGFGNMLNALDSNYRLRSKYRLAAAGQSISFKFVLDRNVFHLGSSDSDIIVTYYKRIYKDKIEESLPSYTTTVNPLKHWYEGAALIVANK